MSYYYCALETYPGPPPQTKGDKGQTSETDSETGYVSMLQTSGSAETSAPVAVPTSPPISAHGHKPPPATQDMFLDPSPYSKEAASMPKHPSSIVLPPNPHIATCSTDDSENVPQLHTDSNSTLLAIATSEPSESKIDSLPQLQTFPENEQVISRSDSSTLELEDNTYLTPQSNSKHAVLETSPNVGRQELIISPNKIDTKSKDTASPDKTDTKSKDTASPDKTDTKSKDTASPDKTSKDAAQEKKKHVKTLRTELLSLTANWEKRKIWCKEKGFTADDCTIKDESEKFYKIVNHLYRQKHGSTICPLCLRKPPKTCESHIFPGGLLRVFRDVHCNGEENFMYDLSTGAILGTHLVCPNMLCAKCELVSSKVEDNLKDVYLSVLDPEVTEGYNHLRFENKDSWFQFIIANIFLRGLLIGCKLDKCLENQRFKAFFWKLIKYCRTSDVKGLFPDIRLFILPNKPLNPKMILFMYSVEVIARGLRFTQVMDEKNEGLFLYSQFDWIHLVAPLDKRSKDYFDKFQNGFITSTDGSFLRLPQYAPCVVRKNKDNILTYHFPHGANGRQFPESLLQINVQQLPDFIPVVIMDQHRQRYTDKSNYPAPKLNENVKVLIERAPNYSAPFDLSSPLPHQGTEYLHVPIKETRIILDFEDFERSKKIERASEISPIAKLQQEKHELEERIEQLEADNKKLVQEMKQLHKRAFFNELRHTIEIKRTTFEYGEELVPPHIKENFDRYSEVGKSDYFIAVTKEIISKSDFFPIQFQSVPRRSFSDSTHQSTIKNEKSNEIQHYQCGVLFCVLELSTY